MRKLLSLLLIFTLVVSPTRAAFDDLGVGGRAPGMADSFVAVADDANALYYNPAGLIQVGEKQLTAQYGQLNRGLTDGSNLNTTYLGYVQPLDRGMKGTLGIGYHNFQASNLLSERMLMMSYGWRLKLQPFGTRGISSAGVTAKQLHRQYQPDRFTENALNDAGSATGESDPLFGSGYSNDKYTFDVGGLYQFGENYNKSVGFNIMNVTEPDVSLAGDGDKVPMTTKIGAAIRPPWGLMSVEMRRAERLEGETDTDYAFGAERTLRLASMGQLMFRGGYAQGSRGFQQFTAGASWLISKIQVDYAFNFPIGNLTDTTGSHRVGLSVHLGMPSATPLSLDVSAAADLLASFVRDSAAMHLMVRRTAVDKDLSPQQRSLLLRLMMRIFPEDDPGMVEVRRELMTVIKNREDLLADWPQIKNGLVREAPETERLDIEQGLELFIRGDVKGMLARFALISPAVRRNDMITAISVMGLGQAAAQAYRLDELDNCIDKVRQVVEALPQDPVIEKGYRELLVRRSKLFKPEEPLAQPNALPEAPATLVAPHPVEPQATPPVPAQDLTAQSYGTALGYYFSRKALGAPAAEREALLNQMKNVYGPAGMDMTLVNRELAELGIEKNKVSMPVPAKQPATQKAGKPAVKKAPKVAPKPAGPTPEFQRGWTYYKQAVSRGLSDHERIEILRSLLPKLQGDEAAQIRTEIGRLEKRLAE